MPDIRNNSIKDAKKILKEHGLQLDVTEGIDEENTIITEQIPKPGIVINSGTKIFWE